MEGAYMKKYGKSIAFSEQYLLECAKVEGNSGCDGGDEDETLKFAARNGNVLRKAWPYTGLDVSQTAYSKFFFQIVSFI